MNSAAESLWFLSPGLSHLLGNAVFAIQGRAQLLAAGPAVPAGHQAGDSAATASTVVGVTADAKAILGGVERARSALMVMRWLAGETDQEAIPDAREVVAAVGEVARLPLRDRGFGLVGDANAGPALWVAPTPFCRLLVAAYRALTGPVGAGLGGDLRLSMTDIRGSHLRLCFQLIPQAGILPFRLDRTQIRQAMGTELADCQGVVEDTDQGDSIAMQIAQASQA